MERAGGDPAALFASQRQRLFGLSYRILGSNADAEDVVQETYLRWHHSGDAIQSAEAWLTTVATRLAIDRLRSAQSRREVYPGIWLPEPIVDRRAWSPADRLETAADLSIGFLYMLERLTPEERAVIVLREAFDYDYAQIAQFLDKSEPACRQLAHRAKEKLPKNRAAVAGNRKAHAALVRRYVDAVIERDESALLQLLSNDVTVVADGGGKAKAAVQPVVGADRVVRFLMGLARKYAGAYTAERALVNSEPGAIVWFDGAPAVMSIETDGERIVRIFSIVNPDKLSGVHPATA